jgi:hypothetical protein
MQRRKRNSKRNGSGRGGVKSTLEKYNKVDSERILTYNGSFMPSRFRNIMRYSEFWRDTTAGGISSYVYRGNGIYDPYAGAAGTGCYGIDVMQSIYGWVKAHRSHITVRLVNAGTEPIMAYLYDSYPSGAPTLSTAESAPRVKRALLNVDAGKEVVLKGTSGITNFTASPQDITWGSAPTGNPVLMWYWKIYLKNVGLSALAVYINVAIDYECEFSLRQEEDDVDA